MHYGADEPAHPVLTAISCTFAALAGIGLGIGGFFLATFFPALLRTALPGMGDLVFVTLWTAVMALPLIAFSRVLRGDKGAGARAYAISGIAAIAILFAGELTGAISVYPWHVRAYIVPGPFDAPPSRPPGR
jgi:ABC-type arginine transport system permease subunit